jgi:hypothetical protein
MRIRSRWLNWLVSASVVLVCRVLFRTLRIHYLAATNNTNPYTNDGTEGFIYCVWHDAIAFPMFAGRHVRTVALVSKNADGSHLAFGLKMLNIGLVRGSSSRGGAGAMRELLKLPVTTHVVVTPDGPRGPRRQVKVGMVFLASHSGRAIVPTAFSAVRSWRIPGSWTSLTIPKPFTKVYALSGPPIRIVSTADTLQMDEMQRQVQSEMDRLSQKADRLAAA